MSDLNKATINMVKNSIVSNSNSDQHKNGGYYLNNGKDQVYMQFGNNRIELWNDGKHLKAYEPKPVDMKEAMKEAKKIIDDIGNELGLVGKGKVFNEKLEALKTTLDSYKDKIAEKDLVNIEAYKLVIQERFKNSPDKANESLQVLINKIPDVAAGKIKLPELPTIKQQAEINISASKQGDQDRSR